ncbi:MAG: TolC family outer membrane protein [Burkholderiaceae bacterium]
MTQGYRPLRLRPAVAATLAALALATAALPAGAQGNPTAGSTTAPAEEARTAAAQAALQAQAAGITDNLLTIWREALANDASFASARYQAQANIEKTPQARAALLPQLGLTAAATRTLSDLDFPRALGGGQESYGSYNGGLQLVAPIYRPQNWETYEQSKLFVFQSETQLAATRQDLVLRTATAYFGVLAARDQLLYLEAAKKATLEQLAQAKREFEVGTKTIIDTNEAQARYDQINAQEQVALGQLLVARSQLQSLIGREPGSLSPLRDRPNLPGPQPAELTPWVRSAEDTNFSVQIARAGTEIANREVQKAKDGHKPTLDFVAGYNGSRTDGSRTAQALTDVYNNRGTNWGFQVNLPIYSGGLTQSRVREMLALDDKARADLDLARRSAANLARDSFTGVSYGLSQVSALESAEVSAKTQLESTQLGYQVGVRILLDVLNATTQLYATQRDLKQARYSVLLSGLKLKATTASLADTDLTAVNALLQ